jgi:hypothetical protein
LDFHKPFNQYSGGDALPLLIVDVTMYDLRHVIDSSCSIVLFGPGEVRYGDKGVHLSLFSSVVRDVEKNR